MIPNIYWKKNSQLKCPNKIRKSSKAIAECFQTFKFRIFIFVRKNAEKKLGSGWGRGVRGAGKSVLGGPQLDAGLPPRLKKGVRLKKGGLIAADPFNQIQIEKRTIEVVLGSEQNKKNR